MGPTSSLPHNCLQQTLHCCAEAPSLDILMCFPSPTPRHSCPQSAHAPSSPKQPWHCHGAHPAQHRASFSILLRAGERFNTYLSDAGSGRCLWGCVGETGLKREGNKSHIAAGLLVHGEVLGLWIDQAGLLAGTWSCSNVMRGGMQGLSRLALMLLSCPCAGWMAAGQTQQSQTEGSLCNGTAPALPQGQKMMLKTRWWMWTCPILPAFPGGKHTGGLCHYWERAGFLPDLDPYWNLSNFLPIIWKV